ncbi:MAG TPA: apolipoprotein N-acyltransferase [Micromonosporaceae bacterium]|nr:apolipoprotein N-acyltransferase [Micromonosporaceae bacterium]
MVDVAPRRMSRLIGLGRNGSVTDRGDRGSPASQDGQDGQDSGGSGSGRDEAGTPPGDSNPAARAVRQPTAPPWWASVAAALVAGPVLIVSFPPYDLWWAAPVGVALLGAAVYRRGVWAGAGLGLLTGLVFLIPLLSWAGIVIGRVYLYLPVGEAGFFALLGAVTAASTPVVQRWRWSWPLVLGVAWVLQEALRDRIPFGGFPWGRLAFAQGDSPLLGLAALGGAPLVTFAVAAIGGLILLTGTSAIAIVRRRPWRRAPEQRQGVAGSWLRDGAVRGLAGALAATAALLLLPLAVPAASPSGRTVNVAIVQGNVPRLGLEFNAQRRAVLDNHVNATIRLAEDVAAGRAAQPDFVVWPENSSDIDPLANLDARARIDRAAQAIGVPILVGGLLHGPGERQLQNVGIVWEPGRGPTHTYVKQHPVPFAEYMPIRSIARMITEKADLVRNDFVPGPEPGVLPINGVTIGDVICFEVAYDNIVRDTVLGGAELIVVQTNNATFNEAEAEQQLAMVRLRAVEHGRPALMASTVGVSAFVDESGNVYDATAFNAPAVIRRDISLTTGRTIATSLGIIPEVALTAAALGVLVLAVALRRREHPGRRWRSGVRRRKAVE